MAAAASTVSFECTRHFGFYSNINKITLVHHTHFNKAILLNCCWPYDAYQKEMHSYPVSLKCEKRKIIYCFTQCHPMKVSKNSNRVELLIHLSWKHSKWTQFSKHTIMFTLILWYISSSFYIFFWSGSILQSEKRKYCSVGTYFSKRKNNRYGMRILGLSQHLIRIR